MGKRKGKLFRSGDCTLGWRGSEPVACFRDEVTGKRQRVRLGLKKATEAQARAALTRFAEMRKLVKAQQTAYTIGDLWRMWLADRAADGYSNTIYEYNWVSLKETFENRDPNLLTADDCREYARGRFALGRSPWTVNTELSRLRACLQWAEKRRHIARAPYVWVPSRGKPRQRVLTADEARRLIEAADYAHIKLFIILALTTGARHRAILDLTWDRIDWIEGTIDYEDDIEIDPMSKSWRKGRAKVPMNALSRAALERAYEARQTDHVIEYGGKRLTTVRDGFAAVARRAGLEDVTPHTIRHSVASWLEERGVELQRVARLLGHSDVRTTESIYAKPNALRYLGEAVEIIEAEFVTHEVQTGDDNAASKHGSATRKAGAKSKVGTTGANRKRRLLSPSCTDTLDEAVPAGTTPSNREIC